MDSVINDCFIQTEDGRSSCQLYEFSINEIEQFLTPNKLSYNIRSDVDSDGRKHHDGTSRVRQNEQFLSNNSGGMLDGNGFSFSQRRAGQNDFGAFRRNVADGSEASMFMYPYEAALPSSQTAPTLGFGPKYPMSDIPRDETMKTFIVEIVDFTVRMMHERRLIFCTNFQCEKCYANLNKH